MIPSFYFNLIFSIIAFLILLFYCYANTIVYYKIFDDLNYYKRFYNDELPIFLNESFNTRKILIMMFILGVISFLIHVFNICLYCILINDENKIRNQQKIDDSNKNNIKKIGENVEIIYNYN